MSSVLGISIDLLFLSGAILLAGGFVNGVSGFGYGMVSMSALTVLFDPRTAAVLMIVPVIAAELNLIGELGSEGLRRCSQRFWPFIIAAAIGTLTGMVLIPWLPTAALTLTIGLVVIAYVLLRRDFLSLSLFKKRRRVAKSPVRSSVVAMLGVGFLGGIVFGGASLGVALVSYLDGFGLDRATFVGVVAMIFLGISPLRIGMTWMLGLYSSLSILWLSVVVTGFGLLGAASGKRVRHVLPNRYVETGVSLLLAISGLRLIATGLGGL